VLAAADAWDAVTSARAYRGAMEPEAAIAHLGRLAGSLLDPGCTGRSRRSCSAARR
jgi:HD-GYP domain-containing protein (c-di-GMP phosphodiesterase class II)